MPKLSRNESCIKYFQTHVCDHEDEYQVIYNDKQGTNSLCTICSTCSLIGSATLVCKPASCSGDVQKNNHLKKNKEVPVKLNPKESIYSDCNAAEKAMSEHIKSLKKYDEEIEHLNEVRANEVIVLKKQIAEIWNNQKNQKNQLMSLKGTIVDIQKSLVKEEAEDEKPMLYACNKCGHKTNGLGEYGTCKSGFCDGVYEEIVS